MSSRPPPPSVSDFDLSAIRFPDFAAEIARGAMLGAGTLKRLILAHGAVLARFGPRRERPVSWIDRMALTCFLETRHRVSAGEILGRGAAGWLELLLPVRGEASWADGIRRLLRRRGAAAAFSRLLRARWPDLLAFEARFSWGRGPGRHVARILGADPETRRPAFGQESFGWEGPAEAQPDGYGYYRGRVFPRHSGKDGGPFLVPGGRLMSMKTLATLPSFKGSEIRIAAAVYNGRPRLDLRRWIPDRERPGIYRPTRQGFAVEYDMVASFIRYMERIAPDLSAAWGELSRLERSKADPREERSATVIPGVTDLSRS